MKFKRALIKVLCTQNDFVQEDAERQKHNPSNNECVYKLTCLHKVFVHINSNEHELYPAHIC